MGKLKLKGKDLRAIGYPEGPVISIAMNIMEKNYKFTEQEDVMNLLKQILASPVEYANDAVLGLIAQQLMPKKQELEGVEISLNQTGIPFNIFGADQIEVGATHQMYQAAKLPIAVAGAGPCALRGEGKLQRHRPFPGRPAVRRELAARTDSAGPFLAEPRRLAQQFLAAARDAAALEDTRVVQGQSQGP